MSTRCICYPRSHRQELRQEEQTDLSNYQIQGDQTMEDLHHAIFDVFDSDE